MKQILQNLATGVTELADIPCPRVRPGELLVRTSRSLISAGTERMLVDFGKASLVEKARQQPDKVRMVLEKVRTDGLVPTLAAVRNKLDQPLALGYCNAGVVIEVGLGVTDLAIGDRVACNGKHAEVVSVPVNLCARIPDGVDDEAAAFTVVGAIALQGIRLAQPTMGEAVAVMGLGLIGQIAVQLLLAQGCRVLGIDPDASRRALAEQAGAETTPAGPGSIAAAGRFSRGRGVDAVLVTAATRSSEPMHHAALMSRTRGRIVLVGVTGLELSRDDFYRKELTFQVSCSYGPGRYDPEYEEKGHDYPIGYVRWTEQRNFEAVLDAMASRRLDVAPLVSHRFTLDDSGRAYEIVGGAEPSLGVILEYPSPSVVPTAALSVPRVALTAGVSEGSTTSPAIAFIGAGSYATGVLIPAFKSTGARLAAVTSNTGVTALHAGRKHGFAAASTDTSAILTDAGIDAVVIATRHDSHAGLAAQAIDAGKHVFVEKPLGLTEQDVLLVETAMLRAQSAGRSSILMVGFNRRFAPHIQKMRSLLAAVSGTKAFIMTVNAGAIPADHWTQDPAVGGGRIIGEACHFVDLLRCLAASPIVAHAVTRLDAPSGDTVTISLRFADGSIGAIHYFANGSKAFPKERLEVFAAGRVLQLDNFRTLRGYGWPGFRRMRLWRQDKGQRACAAAFIAAVAAGGPPPIPLDEILEVAKVTIALNS